MKFQKSLQIFLCVAFMGQALCPPTAPTPVATPVVLSETELLTYDPMNDPYAVAAIYGGLVPATHAMDQEQVSCNVYAVSVSLCNLISKSRYYVGGSLLVLLTIGLVVVAVSGTWVVGAAAFGAAAGAGAAVQGAGFITTIVGGVLGVIAAGAGYHTYNYLKSGNEISVDSGRLYDFKVLIDQGKEQKEAKRQSRVSAQGVLVNTDTTQIQELINKEQTPGESIILYKLLDSMNLPYFPSKQDFIPNFKTEDQWKISPKPEIYEKETYQEYVARTLQQRTRIQGQIDLDKFAIFVKNVLNDQSLSEADKFNRALQLHHWAVLELAYGNKATILPIINMIVDAVPNLKEYILTTAKIVNDSAKELQAIKPQTDQVRLKTFDESVNRCASFIRSYNINNPAEDVRWVTNIEIPDAVKNVILFSAVKPPIDGEKKDYTSKLWKFCDKAIMEVVCDQSQNLHPALKLSETEAKSLREQFGVLATDAQLGKDYDWYDKYYSYTAKYIPGFGFY